MASVKNSMMANESAAFGTLEAARPLRERVYGALEGAIVDRVFPPGWHLREYDLAKQLGVSRNPVREALQGLVHEGLAEHRPGKGVFVHAPSLREIEEVFHARRLLEGELFRMAAGRISDADLDVLETILKLGYRAVEVKDPDELLKLNQRFHHVIIATANNVVMAKMMDTLQQRIRWYLSTVVVPRALASWNQHDAIYQALRHEDGERAAREVTAHVNDTLQMIQDRWNLADDAGTTPPVSLDLHEAAPPKT